ncbi:MAG: 1,4-dihydroxy-2-naphthoate polyprenyltransferase [Magnetospirillum sp.]|nr:1,4-dihydroxy-2-naphthoate polyprenyltransferase [Magnetospirillum sp.]
MTAAGLARPAGWRLWWMAARPRTLSLSVAPVLAGSALAVALGHPFHPGPTTLALAGAVLIQMGTNLHNDFADALRGGDGADRVGPPRVTGLGWVAPGQVHTAALLCFAVAALIGLLLVAMGGWPILALGVASLTAAWGYSGGPRPISATPLGEAFVVAFFGIGAVAGTVWLQVGALPPSALTLGVIMGLPAAAVLMVNNYRDAASDRRTGRRTLAITLGPATSRTVYGGLMLLPFALLFSLPEGAGAGVLALPLAVACIRAIHRHAEGAALNRLLAGTAQCQLLMALTCALGMLISHGIGG